MKSAGYTNSIPVLKYDLFVNTIYIGAQSDINPLSFTGLLKEVRLFTKYHGLAQMQDESIRLYRLYSYDDSKLVAYWKFTEPYSATDIEYTLHDYSSYQNTITYSLLSVPDYPVFNTDVTKPLSLCYFHDVKNCKTLNYKALPPMATSPEQYVRSITNALSASTLTPAAQDQILFLPNNTACSRSDQIVAKLNYTSSTIGWEAKEEAYNPLYLKEASHYQLCYYIASKGAVFNMAQLYIAYRPRTVDPSTSHIYNRTDNVQEWMTGQGDQAFGDVIRFAYDCDTPGNNELEIMRTNTPSYAKVTISSDFNITGDFYFCWNPVFMQDFSPVPIYDEIHNLKFKVQYEPTLKTTFRTVGSVNEDIFLPALQGTFIDGDQFTMTWKGTSYSDCNPVNILGTTYTYNHSAWPATWIGFSSGVYGVNSTLMDEIQACWKPSSDQAPNVFIRVKKEDFSAYLMRVLNYNQVSNQRAPELVSFDPIYGSSTLTENDRTIKFNFQSQSVIPCTDGAGTLGKIVIYRGAVKEDGTYVKTSQVLWQNSNLNESTLPDPFQQGDLICTQTGQCSIILSQDVNRMKAGEIYYLTFYSYSFMTLYGSTKYYLFNTAYPVGTAVYDHLFMCRSYTVYSSNALVNGNLLTIKGVDLKSKVIKAKYIGGNILSDNFHTVAVNIRFKVYNTDSYFCTYNRPTATVAMEDVTNDTIVIKNLELRQCNSGDLYAEYIEVIRGIRDKQGDFTFLRSEKMYNIQLGTVGCHSSCSVCNGTTEYSCQSCSSSTNYLFNGKCYSKCPTEAPYISSYMTTFQNLQREQATCVNSCPYGYFNDPETNICVQCNSDCQTCSSSIIASCLSCNPVKQLYKGICVLECPAPHHSNNYTSYVCNEISKPQNLSVKIQSLGYRNRIPKDKSAYLKADINNTNGGNISTIVWTQLEPDVSSAPDIAVFSNDTDGSHDYTTSVVRLNNNGLMKISISQVVKVQVTVTNSLGQIAYDIYEFFLNDSPFIGDLAVSVVGEDALSTGTSIDSLYRVDLTSWYDSPDDAQQQLKLKVYAIKTARVGQSVVSQQYTLTDQLNQNTIFFRMPPFKVDWPLVSLLEGNGKSVPASLYKVNITLCVQAQDQYFALGEKCRNMLNVSSKYEFSKNYSLVVNFINSLNMTGSNLTNIMLASNILQQAVQIPLRPNSQDSICTLDFHCNYNGKCTGEIGIQKCDCYQGYFGTYCAFQGNELQNLRTIAGSMVDKVLTMMSAKYELKAFDLEVLANVVRGVTAQPDLVDDESFSKVIEMLEFIANSTLYAHKPIDQNVTQIILEAYSNGIVKINHSFKLRRAMKDTLLLGMGLNLQQFTNSFQLSSNPANLESIRGQQYYLSDDQKPYLIGGISSPRKRKLHMQEAELQLYEDWGRRVDTAFKKYLLQCMNKLDPLVSEMNVKTQAFDLYLAHKKTASYHGLQYIKSKDAYWDFPTTIWDNAPGVASRKHELRQVIIKHILNPFKFERNTGVFLESNITTVEFYSLGNSKIPVVLSGSQYIDYREPFNQTQGYGDEYIRCMSWNENSNQFDNDGSCSYQKIWEVIPCSDCDLYNQINTTVSVCRCKHLSRFGIVYSKSNVTGSKYGLTPGIYSDFYAMKYWTESFGFLASIAGLGCFIVGHLFIWFIDNRLQHNLIVRLREKVRRFELSHGATMLRKDGLFFKQDQLGRATTQGKVASKKKVYMKQNQDDVMGLMNPGDQSVVSRAPHGLQEEFKDDMLEGKPKGKKRVLAVNRKVYQDDLSSMTNNQQQNSLFEDDLNDSPVKEQDAYKQRKLNNKGKMVSEKIAMGVLRNFDDNDRIIMKKLEQEKKKKLMKQFQYEDNYYEDKQKDISKMTPQQRAQYERTQKVQESLKKEQTPSQLYHAFMALRYDDINGMTKKEFKRKILPHLKKLPRDLQDDVKDFLSELKGQLNSTDEEMYLNMQDIFNEERQKREAYFFRLRNMIVHGSFLFSLFFVTSLLSPRHIRWSLFFCNIVMLWFICAVFFNNTKDPLAVPDFNRGASSLALKEIWISFLAPWGSSLLMFVVAAFLKMPNSQILNVVTLRQLEAALIEYKRESGMRFFMGYIIVFVIMGTVFWYVIQFTATFGWKVSWVWWYSGIVAIFLQFAIVDPAFSLVNYLSWRVDKRLGRWMHRVRSVTQGYNEMFQNSDDEQKSQRKTNKKHPKKNTAVEEAIDPENPIPPSQPVLAVVDEDKVSHIQQDNGDSTDKGGATLGNEDGSHSKAKGAGKKKKGLKKKAKAQ